MSLYELITATRTYLQEECGDYIFASTKLAPRAVKKTEPPKDRFEDIRQTLDMPITSPVLLITSPLPSDQKIMVDKLTQAINDYVAPAQLIDAKRVTQWKPLLSAPGLKMVIISESTLLKTPSLFSHYKSSQSGSIPMLGSIPALIMADPAVYLQQPSLKKGLWHALQERYRSL